MKNYFELVTDIDPDSLPESLRAGYAYTKEATINHTTWKFYNADEDIRADEQEFRFLVVD